MHSYSRRGFLAFGLCLTLPACTLPRGAAHRREILADAGDVDAGFAVRAVTRATLPEFAHWPVTGNSPHAGWIGRNQGPPAPAIAPGDRLNLRIWDPEESSLITSDDQRMIDMPGLAVSPGGTIFVPYVEEIHVAGMTPDAARRAIQNRMESIIPSAQVQLDMVSGRRNSVDLVSGVSSPGRYPLEDRNTTVLNLIAEAGGVPVSMRNPRLRLMRAGQVFLAPLSQLYADPRRDTTLRGGDMLIVEEDSRYFIALGAAGRQEVVHFTSEDVSALQAVSLMGGVSAARADPGGVLILRRYPASVPGKPGGPPADRVVFSIDLLSADGLFSAAEFAIHSGDVVLATESPTTSVQTIFGLLGSSLGLAGRVGSL